MINRIKKKIQKKIQKLEVISQIKSRTYLSGNYRSLFKGQGYDFKELSEYNSGDPIKYIDWKKYSATGRVYSKRYEDERERRIFFLVDTTKTMEQGFTQSKLESACEFTAYIANTALLNKDKIGLLLFNEEITDIIPPTNNPTMTMAFVERLLLSKRIDKLPNWKSIFQYFGNIFNGHFILFIISDFKNWNFSSSTFKTLQKKGDIIGIHLSHLDDLPNEIEKTVNGVNFNGKLGSLKEAKENEKIFIENLKKNFNIKNYSFIKAVTGDDPLHLIKEFFYKRALING